MASVSQRKGNFSLRAYRGDAKTLLAFNFASKAAAENLAGFTIACQPVVPEAVMRGSPSGWSDSTQLRHRSASLAIHEADIHSAGRQRLGAPSGHSAERGSSPDGGRPEGRLEWRGRRSPRSVIEYYSLVVDEDEACRGNGPGCST